MLPFSLAFGSQNADLGAEWSPGFEDIATEFEPKVQMPGGSSHSHECLHSPSRWLSLGVLGDFVWCTLFWLKS